MNCVMVKVEGTDSNLKKFVEYYYENYGDEEKYFEYEECLSQISNGSFYFNMYSTRSLRDFDWLSEEYNLNIKILNVEETYMETLRKNTKKLKTKKKH